MPVNMEKAYELQTLGAEDRHWWYSGRRRVLRRVITSLNLPVDTRILDAGCGSGRNMVELAQLGSVTGVELSPVSVEAARQRNVGEVLMGSVTEMPFADDSFDLAVCLDVIEHLPDDRLALRELRRVIAPGGSLVVTVPAYQWLWSNHDVINQHFRRYNRTTLLRATADAGWTCQRSSYFNSLLLPLAAALRLLERARQQAPESSPDLWVPPAPANWLLQQPLNLEAAVIGRSGQGLPAGLSLLAILR